jgi:hypothetical protein
MPYCLRSKNLFAGIIFSTLLLAINCIVLAEDSKSQSSILPIVQQIGGIRAASSHDPDVVEKYGEGFFVQNEGHGGGRYYIHPSHTYTFHIEIGVDKLIEDVEIFEGVHLPQAASTKSALSKKLPHNISIDHGIRLGMTSAELIAILGQPHERQIKGDSLTLEYHTSEDDRVFLAYDAYYEFKNDRLIRIRIHDGC